MSLRQFLPVLGWIICCLTLSTVLRADEAADVSASAKTDTQVVSFRRHIAPTLVDHCLPCHGTKKAEGGYRVDTFAELLKPGDSGMIPVVASDVAASELARRLTCDPVERMPEDDEPLEATLIAQVEQWITAGAIFDGEPQDQQRPLNLVMPPVDYPSPPEHYPAPLPITAICFTPNGSQLVTSGYHELLVYKVDDGSLLRRIGNIGERTHALAFSPDGKTLAVGCGEPGKRGEVRLVDFDSGQIKNVVSRGGDVILSLAYRPGGEHLATAAADGLLRIVDLASGEDLQTLASHADWVTSLAWSADGGRLVSGSRDKSAKVYDTATWELVSSYLGHGAAVRGVAISADAPQALSVGGDNKLHRWNLADGAKVAEIALAGEGFAIDIYEGFATVAGSDQRLRKIDLSNNSIAQVFEGHTAWVLCLAEHHGRIASGSLVGEVRLWNLADNQPIVNWLAKP